MKTPFGVSYQRHTERSHGMFQAFIEIRLEQIQKARKAGTGNLAEKLANLRQRGDHTVEQWNTDQCPTED